MSDLSSWFRLALLAAAATALGAQQVAPVRDLLDTPARFSSKYLLGPNDVIVIRAFEAEELSEKPFRIDNEGFLSLPSVGRIKAGGMTVQQLEAALVDRLRPYIKQPQAVVSIVQFRNEPVFMTGAFRSPGVYSLQGQRTLLELLTAVGGLQPNASRKLKLTRRQESGDIPLPNAVSDSQRRVTEVEISLNRLMETVNPAEDIELQAYDVVRAVPKELIYVNGGVSRPGPVELQDRESMSVAQVVSIAGGLTKDARPEKALVLRPVLDTARRAEIRVDLKKVLAGGVNDFPLMPNDVLVVPQTTRSRLVSALIYLAPAAISATIWVLIAH